MRNRIVSAVVFLVLLSTAAAASAQTRRRPEREPHAGSTAVGFEVGAFVPNDSQFQSGLLINALYEYYLRARVSLRTEFGYTDPGLEREPVDSLRQIPLRMDLNYNWEGGAWHPFVGAGFGAYFLQSKDNGEPFGNGVTKPGVNVQGGVEYFMTRHTTFKAEGRYHAIERPAGGPDASGWAISGGLKHYF